MQFCHRNNLLIAYLFIYMENNGQENSISEMYFTTQLSNYNEMYAFDMYNTDITYR
jgi:hypothetical protein